MKTTQAERERAIEIVLSMGYGIEIPIVGFPTGSYIGADRFTIRLPVSNAVRLEYGAIVPVTGGVRVPALEAPLDAAGSAL